MSVAAELTMSAWFQVFADAALKGALVLAVAGALPAFLLRRHSAASRHLVWTLALAAALLQAPLAALVPGWQVTLWPAVDQLATPNPERHAAAPSVLLDALPVPHVAEQATRRATIDMPPRSSSSSIVGAEALHAGAPATRLIARVRDASWPMLLLVLWAAGAVVLVLRLVVSHVSVAVLLRGSRPAPPSLAALTDQLAHRLGAPATPLRIVAFGMPSACGVWRRAIVLPFTATEWSTARLRLVLLHELAHVRRRDCLVQAIAELACAVYWFNPLAWIAARRLQHERERACDDCVLAAGARGSDYADHLIDIARTLRSVRMPLLVSSSVAMAHRSQLEGRLMAILDPSVPRGALRAPAVAAACALAIVLVVPIAGLQPAAQSAPPAAPGVPAVLPPDPAAPADMHLTPAASVAQPVPPAPPAQITPGAPAVTGVTTPPPAAPPPAGPFVMPMPAAAPMPIGPVAQNVRPNVDVARVIEPVVARAMEQDMARVRRVVDPAITAALDAALKDTDAEVRRSAAQALANLHDPAAIEVLAAVAASDADADVRRQVVFALGQLHDPRALKPLSAAVADADADVRQQAVFALGQLRAAGAYDALIGALGDADADVRQQSAFALGELGDARAVSALSGALRDADADVRQQAAFALAQLRDRRATSALVPLLGDSNEDVRRQAAFALGQLKDPAAVDGLVRAAADPSAGMRESVLFALGQIGDARAVQAATAALKDAVPDVRRAAAFALSQMIR